MCKIDNFDQRLYKSKITRFLASVTITMFSITGLLIASLIYHTAYGVPDTQIVGGTNAPAGKYPYQVSLKLKSSERHHCGGAILSKRYIITAAHCLISPVMGPTDLLIDVGTIYLYSSYEMRLSANKLITHPQFNNTIHQNDIGLIRLTKDINFTSNTNLIKLVSFDRNFEGTEFTVTGWGRLWTNGSIPYILQQVKVTGYSQEECGNMYVNFTKNHLCTLQSSKQGICDGDAGSALTLDGALVGIASFGPKAGCASGNPDVFTRVYHYKGWINTYVNAGINQQSNIILGLFMAYLCIHLFL